MADQYLNENEQLPSVLPEYAEDEDVKKKISNARSWLYIVAVVQGGMSVYELFTIEDETVKWVAFGIGMGLAVTFAVLAVFTHKKPFAALLTALILYSLVTVLLALTDPASLVKGIFVKVFFFIAMIKGIKTAHDAEILKKLRR